MHVPTQGRATSFVYNRSFGQLPSNRVLELEKLFHHLPRGAIVEAHNVEALGGGGQASAARIIAFHLAAFSGSVYSVYARWGEFHDVVEGIPLFPTLVIVHRSFGYVERALGLCIFLEGLSFDAYALWVEGVYGFQRVASIVFANCFISTIYNLNGRKLLTWILEDM